MSLLETILGEIGSRSGQQGPKKVKSIEEAVSYMTRHEWQSAVVSEPDEWYVITLPRFRHLDLNNRYTGVLAYSVVVVLEIRNPDVDERNIELRVKRDFGYVHQGSAAKYVLNKAHGREFDTMDAEDQQFFMQMGAAYEVNAFLIHNAVLEELSKRVQQAGIDVEVRENLAVYRMVKTPEHAAQVLESLKGLYTQLPLKVG